MGGGWDRFTRSPEHWSNRQSPPTPAEERNLKIVMALFVIVLIGIVCFVGGATASPRERQPVFLWTWHEPGERGEQMCGPTHTCFGWMEIDSAAQCERVSDNLMRDALYEHDQYFCGYLYRSKPAPSSQPEVK